MNTFNNHSRPNSNNSKLWTGDDRTSSEACAEARVYERIDCTVGVGEQRREVVELSVPVWKLQQITLHIYIFVLKKLTNAT